MPRSPRKPCSVPGCPALVSPGWGRCQAHIRQADQQRNERRGLNAPTIGRRDAARDYSSAGHRSFREEVLARDPYCVICGKTQSTEADHHPQSKRELIELGLDPNDPRFGRGLCHRCHSSETARNQPGGWNAEG